MQPNSVVITGALKGLGFEIGKYFLMNSDLHLCLIDKEYVYESKRFLELNYPKRYSLHIVDLSVVNQVDLVAERIISELNPIILINNLGPRNKNNLIEETTESFRLMLDTVVVSNFLLTRAFLINARKQDNTKLSIINVGSILADLVGPQSPSYHIAKGALQSLTRYFSIEGKKFVSDLCVILVQPGFFVQDRNRVRFEQIENSDYRRLIHHYQQSPYIFSDEDVASSIFHISMHSGSSMMNGNVIDLDYGCGNKEQLDSLFTLNFEGE